MLDRTLKYQVDQIKVVLPEDTSDLHIIYGRDLVTLLTCTPYSVNTHRLLVRGERVEYTEEEQTALQTGKAVVIEEGHIFFLGYKISYLTAGAAIAVFLLFVGGVVFLVTYLRRLGAPRRAADQKGGDADA